MKTWSDSRVTYLEIYEFPKDRIAFYIYYTYINREKDSWNYFPLTIRFSCSCGFKAFVILLLICEKHRKLNKNVLFYKFNDIVNALRQIMIARNDNMIRNFLWICKYRPIGWYWIKKAAGHRLSCCNDYYCSFKLGGINSISWCEWTHAEKHK